MRGPAMFCLLTLAALMVARPAAALVVTVIPSEDNTIYLLTKTACDELPSNGAGSNLFSGFNGEGEERRMLLRFDLSAIPPGSTILSTTLTLNLNKVAPQAPPEPFELHRVAASWGEGTSNADSFSGGGDGAPATAGDATWCDRFFGVTPWSVEGGDFAPTASASTTVADGSSLPIAQTWGSTPGMVADVQGWVGDPASNFGWILVDAPPAPRRIAEGEGTSNTARRFDSSETANTALRPQLVVVSQSIAEVPAASPRGLALLAGLLAAIGLLALFRPR